MPTCSTVSRSCVFLLSRNLFSVKSTASPNFRISKTYKSIKTKNALIYGYAVLIILMNPFNISIEFKTILALN